MGQDEVSKANPAGDVDYDEAALAEAEKRMHAGTGDQPHDRKADPEGGHDPEALEEAAEKMGTDE